MCTGINHSVTESRFRGKKGNSRAKLTREVVRKLKLSKQSTETK